MEAISVGLSHSTLTMQKWSILSHPVFGDPSVTNWEKQVLPEGSPLQLSQHRISCPLEISNFFTDWIRGQSCEFKPYSCHLHGESWAKQIPLFWTGITSLHQSSVFEGKLIHWALHDQSPLAVPYMHLGGVLQAPQLINIPLEMDSQWECQY